MRWRDEVLAGATLWYSGVPTPILIPALVLFLSETVSIEPALDPYGGVAVLE